jgi:PPOX class probable FMN-dependent enzyme
LRDGGRGGSDGARATPSPETLMSDHVVTNVEQLEALYDAVNPVSVKKETAFLTPAYRAWIERAPFFAIASVAEGGLDCSPRGDEVGSLFEVLDDRTIAFPDRRGNNRLDTLRNIVADPRVALLFLVPGITECVRINGRAEITTDPALIARFDREGKRPVTVVRVAIDAVYFQCARALKRSALWTVPEARPDVPTAGQMTKSAVADFDAAAYDAELDARQAKTLY